MDLEPTASTGNNNRQGGVQEGSPHTSRAAIATHLARRTDSCPSSFGPCVAAAVPIRLTAWRSPESGFRAQLDEDGMRMELFQLASTPILPPIRYPISISTHRRSKPPCLDPIPPNDPFQIK